MISDVEWGSSSEISSYRLLLMGVDSPSLFRGLEAACDGIGLVTPSCVGI